MSSRPFRHCPGYEVSIFIVSATEIKVTIIISVMKIGSIFIVRTMMPVTAELLHLFCHPRDGLLVPCSKHVYHVSEMFLPFQKI